MFSAQAAWTIRRKLLQNRLAIGTATALTFATLEDKYNDSMEEDSLAFKDTIASENEEMDDVRNRNNFSFVSSVEPLSKYLWSPFSVRNVTSCSFFSPPFKLARSRTIQRMADTSSKETLTSRYAVQFNNPLGEGGFGAVYIGTDRKTNEKVAVKKIPKQHTDDASFQREMNSFLHIRQRGGHPNICGLRENFDEGGSFFLVLDLVSGGEMFDHLCSHGAYSEADAARLVREVASAMAFLHGVDVVHGDLKPENLMLSSENPSDAVIKVVDFGCAQLIDKTSPYYDGNAVAALTPGYSPPEVVNRDLPNGVQPSIDMFSLGCIIFIMLVGCHPFDLTGTSTEDEINRNVLSRKGPPLRGSQYTKHLSASAIDLIERLLKYDPQKRLTANEMLEHPWVRGETATTGKIADSDKRLKKYRAFKSRLEAKVFASMVEWSDSLADNDVAKRTSLIERSFKMLDPDQRGFITTKELTKKLNPEKAAEADDDDQLSLSGFSALLSENMKNRYFPAGHVVYKEGDLGNEMYFINSGRIEVSTESGFRTTSEQGNFFGEGALLSESSTRSATIKCLTPVHALEISREYFEKYLAGGEELQLSLVEKDKTRKHDRAKALLRTQQNMEKKTIKKGEYLYKLGETGNELYVLEKGKADVIVEDHTVFTMKPGEICGEYSLIFGRPRNTSAKCLSDTCQYHVLRASDFYKLLEAQPSVKESLRDVCFRREFQKAMVYTTKRPFPQEEKDLLEAFNIADDDRSGHLDLSDIAIMLKRMDPRFTEKDIQGILNSLDLDKSGVVSFQEFKRMFER